MTFALLDSELKAAPGDPTVLRAIADWHDVQATMADGMDMADSTKWHTEREKVLRAEADRIEKEWENA